jgi:hypothetical protein
LFVDRSTCTGSTVGTLIYAVGSALRSNRAEVQAKVEYD